MSKYLHYFEEAGPKYTKEYSDNYKEPWASYINETAAVKYNKTEHEKMVEVPMAFVITGDGNIVWKASQTANTKVIEYKKNDGEWTSITSTTEGVSISVVSGDTVQFRGDNPTYTTTTARYNHFGDSTCTFIAQGNIMSLITSEGFVSATTLTYNYALYCLFIGCTALTDATDLIFPATTLKNYCYQGIFSGCTNLTGAPELPATTMTTGCYRQMFQGCTSLTAAPALPATELANSCYWGMFQGCTSLTAPPELPATVLADSCYRGMFTDCTNMVIPPVFSGTTLASNCYNQMFIRCSSLASAPELPATTLASGCYQDMFANCTSLTAAPELNAAVLVDNCYYRMFGGCRNLAYVKCLATDISATNCIYYWMNTVQTTSGTFVKDANMNDWPRGPHGIPNNWTIVDA